MRWTLVFLTVAIAACGPTPEEEETARKQAVAEVEANQEPPPEQLTLDPIRYREIEKHQLYGAGCSLVPDGGGLGAVVLALAEEGFLIRNGELLRFAADAGSAELPYLARQRYTGREYSFTLDLDEDEGKQSGVETTDYRGRLTVRDSSERVVYQAEGLTQCGA
ncbi:hypothetical protein [Qipengyuania vesicularis]|uniref:hypothetical protein n=1 Tax=Qipengyuania vesicularis TaxID=2867232 RepID=UPI001C8797B1|nr:hypothetical protein [Qipengyuania vesicularis]MBX7526732.1 hypothetical protein [Qipengyuania vesicularis]